MDILLAIQTVRAWKLFIVFVYATVMNEFIKMHLKSKAPSTLCVHFFTEPN
mgnify:CR=1 FL=1